jgi:hypothetical protein
MSPVFFFCSMLSEKTKALATGYETEHLIKYQMLFWGSAFFAILLMFLLWHAEMMKAQEGYQGNKNYFININMVQSCIHIPL